MKRKIIWIFVSVFILLAVVVAFRAIRGKDKNILPPSTVKADVGAISMVLKEVGAVEAKTTVDVRSKMSGKIKVLYVEDGDTVSEGDTVATIEPDVNEALSIIQKRTRVESLRQETGQAKREHERLLMLYEKGFTASQELERAENRLADSERNYKLEKTALEALERDYNFPPTSNPTLADYQVLAPISGVVTEVLVKEGELVTSGISGFAREGSHLMTIADIREMIVTCEVSEVDIASVKTGVPVSVYPSSHPTLALKGKIDRVSLAGKSRSSYEQSNLVRFEIRIALDDARHPALKPGLSCKVDITADSRENVLRIPITAFREDGGKAWVMLKKSGAEAEFQKQDIKLGLRADRYVEVLGGLKAGDEIKENPVADDAVGAKGAGGRRRFYR